MSLREMLADETGERMTTLVRRESSFLSADHQGFPVAKRGSRV